MKLKGYRTCPRVRAFTLVELLVVVVIIAILAAIAIPNMLLAQTRAKVSRAHADLRTAVVAVEAYHADHASYMDLNGALLQESSWSGLTSPVSYLSSTRTMLDVFGPWYDQGNPEPGRCYAYLPYARLAELPHIPMARFWNSYYGPYAIQSIGPGRVNAGEDYTSTIILTLRYDPSNGTNSLGWIIHAPNLVN